MSNPCSANWARAPGPKPWRKPPNAAATRRSRCDETGLGVLARAPSNFTLRRPPANSMSSSASSMSAEMTELPPSRVIPPCAMRRHQLLDEGGADAFGAPRDLADDGLIERQALAVEPNQFAAADLIRQRHLDRLVDAAGTTGQRAFELFGPVGGED